jgi:hypothetical protein
MSLAPTPQPPRRLHFASDPVRAGVGLARWPITASLMRTAASGDGAPVLVLPGLLVSDLSTRPLRAQLRSLGHHVPARDWAATSARRARWNADCGSWQTSCSSGTGSPCVAPAADRGRCPRLASGSAVSRRAACR